MNQKIGLCITTYKRPSYFEQVFKNLPFGRFDHLVVVNDGIDKYVPSPQTGQFDQTRYPVIYGNKQNGVSWSKNRGIEKLLELECTHIFTMDDDVIIIDENVFQKYIDTAYSTGIYHLTFEQVAGNEKTLKYEYRQPNGEGIRLYHNPQAAFCYTHANIYKKFGLYDENMINPFEHISFSYNLVQKKLLPPFWYNADVLNSDKYLTTIKGSDENSTITNKDQYKENWEKSAQAFIRKHGHFTNQIPDVGIKVLKESLKFLETNYSRKKEVNGDKKLSIIIPYRDRQTALETLIPKLSEYVTKQVKLFDITVIEQDDNELFNKGLLNNLGVLLNPDTDYYCVHDVDLIPEFSDYSYPENPSHLSTFCSQFGYTEDPAALMGGVVLFKREHFFKSNGYPNDYVGWGSEDNTLANRVKKVGLSIYSHPFGRYFSIPHVPRIQNLKEYEMHLINGKKREDEKSEITNFLENGINNIDISKYSFTVEDKDQYKHYKIKL